MTEKKDGLTRRDFFKAAAGLGVLAVVGPPRRARAEDPENPSILVVGWDGADYRSIKNNPDRCPTIHSNYLARLDCAGCEQTKPGWAELVSGLEHDVTEVRTDYSYKPILLENNLFYKLKVAKPGYYQACIWSMEQLGHVKYPDPYWPDDMPFKPLWEWASAGYMNYYADAGNPPHMLCIDETEVHLAAALAGFEPPGIVWCHYSRPDNIGHLYGPDSEEYKHKLAKLDTKLASAIATMQPDIWFAVSDHGFDPPRTPDPNETEHPDAPDGFVASNLPLVDNCVRRDVGFTLHQLLGLSLISKRREEGNNPTDAWLRGKSILA